MKIKKIALILLVGGVVVNNNSALAIFHHSKSDGRIRKTVDGRIDKYPNLDDDVNIKVKDGCVILTGTVDNSAEKQEAVNVVSNIGGVREIDDRLKVKNKK